jgi:hypothetical protein
MHVEGRDNNVKRFVNPLGIIPWDVEDIIDPMKVIVFTFSFFLILPSFYSTFYSLDYKSDIRIGQVLDNRPLLSPFPLA